ncbi:MAG: L,D-transpeptidase family protein, partial [Prochlorococcaceae cyanobacterium]
HFGEYKGVFRWYSYAIHGTQDEERIGKRITGGCINVDDATMATLLKSVKLGDEVVVSSDGPCNE